MSGLKLQREATEGSVLVAFSIRWVRLVSLPLDLLTLLFPDDVTLPWQGESWGEQIDSMSIVVIF